MDQLQEFMNISPTIKAIHDSAETVGPKEFIRLSQPGDILISSIAGKLLPTLPRIFNRSLALAQGGMYTSSKVVGYDNDVVGYGANLKSTIMSKNKLDIWLNNMRAVLLLRKQPQISEKQKFLYMKYMYDRIGTKYGGTKELLNSLIMRNIDDTQSEKQRKIIVNNLDNNYPLICSAIIYFAMLYANIKVNFDKDIYSIWPKDFITSPQFKPICKYIEGEE
jgi:hypothetical protein